MNCSYVDEKLYVWVQYTGLWTMEKMFVQPQIVLAECLARKKDLVLLDFMNVENQKIAFLDRWRLGISLVSAAQKLSKVAAAAPARIMDSEQFAVRVARNRGVNIQGFSDLDDARRWLLAGQMSPAPSPS